MPALEPSCPTIGLHHNQPMGVVWASQRQPFLPSPKVPLDPPDQRDSRLEREAGTYLRLRRVWLVQRAPISAATPASLMELLCRLQTEERAHLAWLSQDPEGVISPAEALSSTGSWGIPEAGATPHCSFHNPPFLSILHIPAPARSGQVGIAQPAPEFRLYLGLGCSKRPQRGSMCCVCSPQRKWHS